MKNYNMILTEKQQKHQRYCLLIKEEWQNKLSLLSPLRKALEKQAKTIENLGKKLINAIKDHGKQLVESSERVKKDFNIDRYSTPHE